MDVLASAVASDLIGRCLSFLFARYQKHAAIGNLARLHRLLLRARAVVEEAEARHITNTAMLAQLDRLRDDMYRGYYVIDAFQRRVAAARRPASVSSALSFFDAAAVDGGCGGGTSRLKGVVDGLEAALGDMKEFVVFLSGYPRVARQPYSAHLYMGSCVFGRHSEKERVVEFLLRPCSPPGVLPITGPPEIGKKTLVEHVCADERVRRRFSLITRLSDDDLVDGDKHREHVPAPSGGLLFIVEFAGEPDEAAWRRFYSSVREADSSSKIIAISRREQVSTLATGQSLRLATLHKEEYWYFFKVLAFGSADPAEHPELAPIVMDMAGETKGSFMALHILSRLMSSSLDARFWRRLLEVVRHGVRANYSAFGEHPIRLPGSSRLAYLCGAAEDAPLCLYYDWCKQAGAASAAAGLPKVTLQEVLDGSVVPRGGEKMDVLVWRSQIPPYYNYVANCAVEKEKPAASARTSYLKRKRLQQQETSG